LERETLELAVEAKTLIIAEAGTPTDEAKTLIIAEAGTLMDEAKTLVAEAKTLSAVEQTKEEGGNEDAGGVTGASLQRGLSSCANPISNSISNPNPNPISNPNDVF
jgi:hypothetical protein